MNLKASTLHSLIADVSRRTVRLDKSTEVGIKVRMWRIVSIERGPIKDINAAYWGSDIRVMNSAFVR